MSELDEMVLTIHAGRAKPSEDRALVTLENCYLRVHVYKSVIPIRLSPLRIASRDKRAPSMWPSTKMQAVEKMAEAVCSLVEGS
jgi:hypothetical protein